MNNRKQKLELNWVGKNNPEYDISSIEGRILEEIEKLSYGDKTTDNIIIHGDNLLALKALLPEYEGKIKCIYIDPPYNTGSAFKDYDDSVEHSTWLSLMKPRLELLKKLMRDDGVIYVQIDDNEQAYLQMLMHEIFGPQNFISCLPVIQNLKGNQDQFGFAGTHEYILVYGQDKTKVVFNEFTLSDEEAEQWEIDEIGYYKKGAPLRATGEESKREDRPSMFYPILIKENVASTISEEEYKKIYDSTAKIFNDPYLKSLINFYTEKGFDVVLPMVNPNTYGRWRWGYTPENIARLSYDVIVNRSNNSITLYKKQRPEIGELPSKKPKSLFYKPEYSSANAKSESRKLFGGDYFSYPKAEQLMFDLISISTNPNDFVLDSFIGSGTTVAVAHKMNRRYIGIEMGNQAYTHSLKRLHMVVDGNDGLPLSKAIKWKGGGGFKFYELAPSFITVDEYGNPIIDSYYNDVKLIKAMCKLTNYTYAPSSTEYWKHGKGQGNNNLFVTTQMLSVAIVQQIATQLKGNETLLICPKKFEPGCEKIDQRITIKKIPQSILKMCQFGKKEYLLPVKDSLFEGTQDQIK